MTPSTRLRSGRRIVAPPRRWNLNDGDIPATNADQSHPRVSLWPQHYQRCSNGVSLTSAAEGVEATGSVDWETSIGNQICNSATEGSDIRLSNTPSLFPLVGFDQGSSVREDESLSASLLSA